MKVKPVKQDAEIRSYIDIVYKLDSLSSSSAAINVTKSQSSFVLQIRKADPIILTYLLHGAESFFSS